MPRLRTFITRKNKLRSYAKSLGEALSESMQFSGERW
jgi:hypothetical protein